MLEIDYDTTEEPTLAVGWGADYIQEVCKWVVENNKPMIYRQKKGQFLFVHGPAGGIEQGWRDVNTQNEAARRAREILRRQSEVVGQSK
jgi:hypothetical protein